MCSFEFVINNSNGAARSVEIHVVMKECGEVKHESAHQQSEQSSRYLILLRSRSKEKIRDIFWDCVAWRRGGEGEMRTQGSRTEYLTCVIVKALGIAGLWLLRISAHCDLGTVPCVRMRESQRIVTRITDEAVALAMGAFYFGPKPVVGLAGAQVFICPSLIDAWKTTELAKPCRVECPGAMSS